MSRHGILRGLSSWSHSMPRQSLNAAINFPAADGSVAEGSKGLLWVPQVSPELERVIRKARSL
jgi:hypothetical protein